MASKRILKKRAMDMLYDVASECDYIISTGNGEVEGAQKLLNDVEDCYSEFVSKINSTNDKKALKALKKQIEEDGTSFIEQANKLA
ncbi:MAG: hypothetical protein AB8B56_21275 [Crocinitomicaceae bacterium]